MNPKYAPAALSATPKKEIQALKTSWGAEPPAGSFSPYLSAMPLVQSQPGMSPLYPTANYHMGYPETLPHVKPPVSAASTTGRQPTASFTVKSQQVPAPIAVEAMPATGTFPMGPMSPQLQMSPVSYATNQMGHMSLQPQFGMLDNGFSPLHGSYTMSPPVSGGTAYSLSNFSPMYSPSSVIPAFVKAESPSSDDSLLSKDRKTRKISRSEIETELDAYPADSSGGNRIRRKMRKNTREKQRRLELNDQARAEKYTILAEAITLIGSLQHENVELRREKTELRAENGKLTATLQAAFPASPPDPSQLAAASAKARVTVPVPDLGGLEDFGEPLPSDFSDLQSTSDLHSELPGADEEEDEVTPDDDLFGDLVDTAMDDELI